MHGSAGVAILGADGGDISGMGSLAHQRLDGATSGTLSVALRPVSYRTRAGGDDEAGRRVTSPTEPTLLEV